MEVPPMSKIRETKALGNWAKRQPRAPAGLAEDWLGGLCKRLGDPDALGRFVAALSEKDRKLLRTEFRKLSLRRQEEIYCTLVQLSGPGTVLQRELLEDRRAWADRLPRLKEEPPLVSEEEWHGIYVGAGFSDEEARERAAKEVKRSSDDLLREAHAGTPPELIEELIADHKRATKMDAISEVVRPAIRARAERDAEDRLGSLANESWKRAEKTAADTRHLAWCLYDFDEIKNSQRDGLEPIRTEWAESELAEFRETVASGASLSDVLAALADVAEALGREMKAMDGKLSKAAGRPKDDFARLAAKRLREIGLNPTETAEVLEWADLADYDAQYVGRKGRHVTDLLRGSSRKPLRK
jgi:hypothetical protein